MSKETKVKFSVGDEVICDFGYVGKVVSVDSKNTVQPIMVEFFGNGKGTFTFLYTEEGVYHPRRTSKYDIRKLTKLDRALR